MRRRRARFLRRLRRALVAAGLIGFTLGAADELRFRRAVSTRR